VKSFLYWLLGDRGGRIVVGTWSWLLGQPIEKGDAKTISIAREALVDIEENVNQLTSAVAEQQAALASAQELYHDMQRQSEQLQRQAEQLVQAGEENAALDVLSELEIASQALPQLKQQVEVAQSNFEASKANLVDMQRSLRQMQAQQKYAASMEKVTAALSKANALSAPSSNSAKATLDEAHDAVKRRSALETAKSELNAQGSATNRKINELSAADRLAALKAKNNPELPPSK
jgi:phage shock protein A